MLRFPAAPWLHRTVACVRERRDHARRVTKSPTSSSGECTLASVRSLWGGVGRVLNHPSDFAGLTSTLERCVGVEFVIERVAIPLWRVIDMND